MSDLERILALWREVEARAEDYVLATIVAVEGSSYRRPGACMLLAESGHRAGAISGGCLEAQVASRARWLTADGPSIQSYSTREDDGERPYGSGCGGVVHLLLERQRTADPLLMALNLAHLRRVPLAVATVLEGPRMGWRAFAGLEREGRQAAAGSLQELAKQALAARKSMEATIAIEGVCVRAWADFRPARPGVWVFGAGDDAQPLVRLAKELDWFVAVADGRSNLATAARFPLADAVRVLPTKELKETEASLAGMQGGDAAIVMTHSFEQDAAALAALLALPQPPAYIGVLGPQRRTRELLAEAGRLIELPASSIPAQAERWLAQLHAPTGLDLGADTPETIALSVLAEIQKCLTGATALPLREVRAASHKV